MGDEKLNRIERDFCRSDTGSEDSDNFLTPGDPRVAYLAGEVNGTATKKIEYDKEGNPIPPRKKKPARITRGVTRVVDFNAEEEVEPSEAFANESGNEVSVKSEREKNVLLHHF